MIIRQISNEFDFGGSFLIRCRIRRELFTDNIQPDERECFGFSIDGHSYLFVLPKRIEPGESINEKAYFLPHIVLDVPFIITRWKRSTLLIHFAVSRTRTRRKCLSDFTKKKKKNPRLLLRKRTARYRRWLF